jgi:hypothetical protein
VPKVRCVTAGDRTERQARLRTLLGERTYDAAVTSAAAELSEILDISGADGVSRDEAQAALDTFLAQNRFHLVWHRAWGARLRDEVLETCGRIAARLGEEVGVVVWSHQHGDGWQRGREHVGFRLQLSVALQGLAPHVGPPRGDIGTAGKSSDLLLVSSDLESGLHLDYNHYANADEYEMRVWGQYAFAVASDI